ncbi:uncharacterized protein MELLADRAFT_88181 [Melampsora larici-populina 98AG31]|uniref:Uncharacterized protein n=1 Tax=Melampsora larici-populina (strain 98AG31 / pathotype 3-4-7) TaxID=747676 RepID=F4RQV6_MELLP|nr:uncharacterized protein MELLADRAFT_88181 [Melampsora larici-populina 98AG31]EGG05108.1 hypothetical protein MELLADRAFT_88181 [Melampsora larici-populina 98AG31]
MKPTWKWTHPHKIIASQPNQINLPISGPSALPSPHSACILPLPIDQRRRKTPLLGTSAGFSLHLLNNRSHQDSGKLERNYSKALHMQSASCYAISDLIQEGESSKRPSFRTPTIPIEQQSSVTSTYETAKPAFFDRATPPHLLQSKKKPWADGPITESAQDLTTAISNGDFELAVSCFERLSPRRKSKLATRVYNSLFNLAAYDGSCSAVSRDVRISKIEGLFNSFGRKFSHDQVIRQLEVSIHAAAFRLRDSAESDLVTVDSNPQTQLIDAQNHISEIICRLPKLDDVTNTTSDDLAHAIPFRVLGLYARFLALFHQPGQPLKMMRKIYYAYLIGRRRACDSNEDPNASSFPDSAGIETGTMIMIILRNKIHHRMSGLKLAIRMISKGDLYPDQDFLSRLLRRMYLSKSEWDSVIHLQSNLDHPMAARWLHQQIALVESQNGRMQRASDLAHQALYQKSNQPLNLAIFTHAIQAIIDRRHSVDLPEEDIDFDLQEALKMRENMLDNGFVPASELDDIMLRAIYQSAKNITHHQKRSKFLQTSILSLFPRDKMVRMFCPDAKKKIESHPGKSVEAFRLMRWLMRWNELDLALIVFQSMSRYGYITSLGALPTLNLKRLLDQALLTHPELGAELYQHISSSGYDSSGIFFKALETKAIQMADVSLIGHLLKITEERQNERIYPAQITRMIERLARRRPTPGNVEKTMKLFRLVWNRWKSELEITVFERILNQLQKMKPIKLQTRSELRPLLESTVACLSYSGLCPKEAGKLKDRFMEYMADTTRITDDDDDDDSVIDEELLERKWISQLDSSSLQSEMATELYEKLLVYDIQAAKESLQKAIELDILIPAHNVGILLNILVDEKRFDEAIGLDRLWRGMSWKFKVLERGDDRLIIEAMDRIERQSVWPRS